MNGSTKLFQFGMYAAGAMLIGIVLSGLVGVPLVNWLSPQPAWQNGEIFAQNFEFLQTLPYYAGMVMLTGFLLFHVTIYLLSGLEMKRFTLPALLFALLYAALVFFNYVMQTTFVPELARNYQPAFDPFIAAFSMTNPAALGWALEMWGYGLLGVASLFAVPFYLACTDRLNKSIAVVLILNGVMSILGAFITALDLPWVFTVPGMVLFVLWNIVALALALLLVVSFHRQAAPKPRTQELQQAHAV